MANAIDIIDGMEYRTVKDVAAELGVTVGRIRQIAIQYEIGYKMSPNLRVFSPADVERTRAHTRQKRKEE